MELQATEARRVSVDPAAKLRREREEVRAREERRERESGDRIEISREAAQRLEQDREESRREADREAERASAE